MSYRAKRELLAQTAPRYQEAGHQQKSVILDEFVAATGYACKYAIRLLASPVAATHPAITRSRERRYGPAVQAALRLIWEAANCICAKRLVPFLPELVPVLERHGHLTLADSDNGKELLNNELLDYCEREGITFTRGRAYKKNDQCVIVYPALRVARGTGYDVCDSI